MTPFLDQPRWSEVLAGFEITDVFDKEKREWLRRKIENRNLAPDYGFAVHKGYCTAAHQRMLDALGPSPIHRWRFENVARTARVDSL